MNRLLQIILAGVITVYSIKFLVMAAALPLMFRKTGSMQGNIAEMGGKGLSVYAVSAGPARLSVEEKTGSPGLMYYFGFEGLSPAMKMNDDYYVTGAKNEMIKVKYEPERQQLSVPVSEKKFTAILVISILLMVLYLAIMIYVSFQLFRFARETGKENFFTGANRRRLRIIGWFILGTGILNYLFHIFIPTLLEMISGMSGMIMSSPGAFPPTPGWIIAGLLLLIVAEAFSKGFQLQQEQDYTI